MFSTLLFLLRALRLNRLSRADPAVVARLQARRLRRLLRYAARSRLYRDKYRGLDPARTPLDQIPPLTRAEAMARFDDWVTDPAVTLRGAEAFIADSQNIGRPFLGKYVLMHTSGSQGQPVVLVQTRAAVDLLFLLQSTRGNATGETGLREAVRRLRDPARLAAVTLKEGFYPTGATFAFYPKALRPFVRLLRVSQTDPDLVARLNDFSPTVVTGYSSVLLGLADEAAAGRLRLPHLRHLVNNSELLSDPARERLRAVFGGPVLNNYATAECLHLTNGCPTDPGMHVNADWAVLENVDAAGRPVPPGTPGAKVLLTNLANFAQPVIRYEVTDVVTLADGPCRCGSRLPRVGRVDGRSHDAFWARDGAGWVRVDAFILMKALIYSTEVVEWRAEQDEPGVIRLAVAVAPGRTLDEIRLRNHVGEQLRTHGLDGRVRVDVRQVARIPPDPRTGKVKRAVCRTGPHPEPATGHP